MSDDRHGAAERLGTPFISCAHCLRRFIWKQDKVFSIWFPDPDPDVGYEFGGHILLFCSHKCASKELAKMPAGSVWYGGEMIPELPTSET